MTNKLEQENLKKNLININNNNKFLDKFIYKPGNYFFNIQKILK